MARKLRPKPHGEQQSKRWVAQAHNEPAITIAEMKERGYDSTTISEAEQRMVVRLEWYRLRDALYQADYSTAESLLRESPSLLEERNRIGETVLHFLAIEDCLPGIEWLHARGASLHVTNKFGTPLLFEVAQIGHRNLLRWLVAHGADPNQKDSCDRSIQDYLAEFGRLDLAAFVDEQAPPHPLIPPPH